MPRKRVTDAGIALSSAQKAYDEATDDVELTKDGHPRPRGTDGWIVFRVPPPEPEPGNTRKVTVDCVSGHVIPQV